MKTWRVLAFSILAAFAVCVSAGVGMAADKVHRLALQISDNDPDKMNAVLNVAANVAKEFSSRGEETEIRIVAFYAGLHMLREDTSPVKERVLNFSKSLPNVTFNACGNTIEGMTKKEGKAPPILSNAKVVPAGVVTLMELGEAGWTIVRP